MNQGYVNLAINSLESRRCIQLCLTERSLLQFIKRRNQVDKGQTKQEPNFENCKSIGYLVFQGNLNQYQNDIFELSEQLITFKKILIKQNYEIDAVQKINNKIDYQYIKINEQIVTQERLNNQKFHKVNYLIQSIQQSLDKAKTFSQFFQPKFLKNDLSLLQADIFKLNNEQEYKFEKYEETEEQQPPRTKKINQLYKPIFLVDQGRYSPNPQIDISYNKIYDQQLQNQFFQELQYLQDNYLINSPNPQFTNNLYQFTQQDLL